VWVVVEPTPEALAVALSDAVDLIAADRHAMGLKGREYVRTAFSWDGIGSMTTQLYDWVLDLTSSVPQSCLYDVRNSLSKAL